MPHLILTNAIDPPFYQHETNLTGHQIPQTDYDHLAEIGTIYKRGGRRLKIEEQISAVDFYSSRPLKSLYPIHQIAEGAVIVRQEVKQEVESLDGTDKHQFVEIEVSQKGNKIDVAYFLWNIYHTNQAIDLQSDGVKMVIGFDRKERPQIRRRKGVELKLKPDFQADSHVWRDAQFTSGNVMISDQLFQALNAGKYLARVPSMPVN